MSRAKDATSKKRKLTDVDQNDQNVPPRKSRIIPNSSTEEIPVAIPDAESGLQNTVVDNESGARVNLAGQKKYPRQRAGIPARREDLLEDPHTVEDAKDEKTREHYPQSECKDKAALRQAKSERRSKKKRESEPAETAQATDDPVTVESAAPTTENQEQPQDESAQIQDTPSDSALKPQAKQRLILFIGNLPYTATTTSIQAHFSKLQPFTVRHSTDKETGRSRGFAFLEFEGYDKMKTCLKLYHHSLFDTKGDQTASGAGERRKSQPRKINVELTAGGGGGKSASRKEKIKGKNEKLEAERERARVQREKEEAAANRKKQKAGDKTGANAVEMTNGDGGDENIHPSRRKRMNT
jgi:nucleolar protein 6